jgi:SAM-dependent methyltransferase
MAGPFIGLTKRLIRKAVRWYVAPQIDGLRDRLTRAEQEAAAFRAQQTTRVDELRQQADELRQQLEIARRYVDPRVALLEQHLCALPYVNPTYVPRPNPNADGSFDYAAFEEKFRGPAQRVEGLLDFYVPYFQGCRDVVDLGCGNGEFLAALRRAGLDALGVDSNSGQLAQARARGLNVVEADLFAYLESLPDSSLDGVFAAQVIEHLPFPLLNRFLPLVHQKLRPGGVAVAETVNPHFTPAFKFFYLDPTHVAPLFPEVVEFYGETAGFTRTAIAYPDPCGLADPRFACCRYALVAHK